MSDTDPALVWNHDSDHARIERIEARQRAHSIHDPDCPVFLARVAQAQTSAYVVRPDCECWLAGGPSDV